MADKARLTIIVLDPDWCTGYIAQAIASRLSNDFEVKLVPRNETPGDTDLIWATHGLAMRSLAESNQRKAIMHLGSVRTLKRHGYSREMAGAIGVTCESKELIGMITDRE